MSFLTDLVAYKLGLDRMLTEEGKVWLDSLGSYQHEKIARWLRRLPPGDTPEGSRNVRELEKQVARLQKTIDILCEKEAKA